MVNVNAAKEAIYSRLRMTEPGPGYIHFPIADEINAEYFEQLSSEQIVTKYREGRAHRVWILPSGKQNEALDTFVYALAASRAAPMGGRESAQLAPLLPGPEPSSSSVPLPPAPMPSAPIAASASDQRRERISKLASRIARLR